MTYVLYQSHECGSELVASNACPALRRLQVCTGDWYADFASSWMFDALVNPELPVQACRCSGLTSILYSITGRLICPRASKADAMAPGHLPQALLGTVWIAEQ